MGLTDFQTQIPIPEKSEPMPKIRKSKYPFKYMKVNDSFLYSKDPSRKSYARADQSVRYWNKKLPERKFEMRRYKGTIRVWRTK